MKNKNLIIPPCRDPKVIEQSKKFKISKLIPKKNIKLKKRTEKFLMQVLAAEADKEIVEEKKTLSSKGKEFLWFKDTGFQEINGNPLFFFEKDVKEHLKEFIDKIDNSYRFPTSPTTKAIAKKIFGGRLI